MGGWKGARVLLPESLHYPRPMLGAGSSSGVELFQVTMEPGWNGGRERWRVEGVRVDEWGDRGWADTRKGRCERQRRREAYIIKERLETLCAMESYLPISDRHAASWIFSDGPRQQLAVVKLRYNALKLFYDNVAI